jgi:hypothetical protein
MGGYIPKPSLPKRSEKIDDAMEIAKERDKWKCQACGRSKIKGDVVCGSHCFPRNVQDPTDPDLIVTLCWKCDREFDSIHNLRKRAAWLRKFPKCQIFAVRMAERDGRCAD